MKNYSKINHFNTKCRSLQNHLYFTTMVSISDKLNFFCHLGGNLFRGDVKVLFYFDI